MPTRMPIFGGAVEARLEMECDVAGEQDEDQCHHAKIIPLLAGNDLAGCRGRDQQQEAAVHQHGGEPTSLGRKGDACPACDPKRDEKHQRASAQRQPPCPVRDRREQETRYHRRQETVEHLVDVPVAGNERGDQLQFAHEHRQPYQDGKSRVDGAQQEEWTEAVGEQCRSVIGSCCTHGGFLAFASFPIFRLHFSAVLVVASFSNSPAITCLALPSWGTALAASTLSGVPTTTIATMPMP